MELTDFVEELNALLKDLFNITDEKAELVMLDDGVIYTSIFNISFEELNTEDETSKEKVAFISYNDSLNTSMLIRVALTVNSFIEDMLDVECVLDNCHWIKFNDAGEVSDILTEAEYKKTHEVTKE